MTRFRTYRAALVMLVLMAIASLTITFFARGQITTAQEANQSFFWGVNGHPLKQEGYIQVSLETQINLVSRLGMGWYRVDLPQSETERNLTRLDTLVAMASRRKIRILGVLFSSPGGYSEDVTPTQVRQAAFEYGRAMASRYATKITHWELANELDVFAMIRKGERMRTGEMWEFGPPDGDKPEHYQESRYQIARAEIQGLSEGVRAGNQKAVTVVDTAGWLHYGFIERLVVEDKVPFNILAWHWYSEMGNIQRVNGKLDLLQVLVAYGKPIQITEINRRYGSQGGKEKEQAAYLVSVANQLCADRRVAGLFIYELLDEPYFGEKNPESWYGLVTLAKNRDGNWQATRKKQAFAALKAVIAGKRC